MIDARDRLLDYALTRVLGPESVEVDLTERVVDAWRRGDRPRSWEPIELLPPVPEAPRRRALGPWKLAGLAASLAGIGLVGFALWNSGPALPTTPPIAQASREVEVLAREAAGVETVRRSALQRGDGVILPEGERLRLDLEGGGSVDLRGPAALRIGEAPGTASPAGLTVTLEFGRVLVHRDAGPLAVEAGLAGDERSRIELAPASTLRIEVLADALDSGGGPLAWLTGAARSERFAAWWLGSGSATLVGEGRTLERGAWEYASVQRDTTADRKTVAQMLEKLRFGMKPYGPASFWPQVGWEEAVGVREELTAFLAERPSRWLVLADELAPHLGSEARPADRDRALDLLVTLEDENARRRVLELWHARPEDFNGQHLVALAEAGSATFLDELRDLAEFEDPDEADLERAAQAAVWLALHGDDRGAPLLRRLVREPEPTELSETWVRGTPTLASIGLAAAGEPDAWRVRRAGMLGLAEEALDEDLDESARMALLTLEYLDGLLAEPRPPLSFYFLRLGEHLLRRGEEVGPHSELRALLADLRSR